MTNRTLHENTETPLQQRDLQRSVPREIEIPTLLSTMWIAILLADALRGIHETVRPGFIRELANEGTVYGNTVTDETLLASGFVLTFICVVVVLARILPRRSNRIVNVLAGLMMIGGVASLWPKDPDDLVFGVAQIVGSALVLWICARWRSDSESTLTLGMSPPAVVRR